MRTLKSLLGLVVGGIGALVGLSGCSEDDSAKPVTRITPDELRDCCGDDDGSQFFATCIEEYQKNGVCSGYEPTTKYGPIAVEYGVPYDECCGDLTGDEYEDCVDDYLEDGICNNEMPEVVYGPDPYPCCGEDDGSEEYTKCFDEYFYTGNCPNEIIAPIYGMPELSEEEIENCCGDESGSDYDACVEEYKNTLGCPVSNSTVYGMPDIPIQKK